MASKQPSALSVLESFKWVLGGIFITIFAAMVSSGLMVSSIARNQISGTLSTQTKTVAATPTAAQVSAGQSCSTDQATSTVTQGATSVTAAAGPGNVGAALGNNPTFPVVITQQVPVLTNTLTATLSSVPGAGTTVSGSNNNLTNSLNRTLTTSTTTVNNGPVIYGSHNHFSKSFNTVIASNSFNKISSSFNTHSSSKIDNHAKTAITTISNVNSNNHINQHNKVETKIENKVNVKNINGSYNHLSKGASLTQNSTQNANTVAGGHGNTFTNVTTHPESTSHTTVKNHKK